MPEPASDNRLRRAAAIAIALVVLFTAAPGAGEEVRAIWVVRTSMTSPGSIAAMVDAARAGGFNTLLVQIRGRGDAYYVGGPEPRAEALAALPPGFDPLAETLTRAKAAGMQVHAWFNVNLVAGTGEPPLSPTHVVNRHPEWLMVPRPIAQELANADPRNRRYVDRLLAHLRTRNDVEGLYLSPLTAEAADYTTSVARELVTRYAVDGLHLDYVRYPAEDFDYSAAGLAAFRQSVLPDLGAADRARYDARLAREPLIYTQAFPERWKRFRQTQLTRLVVKIREAVKAVRPDARLSAAVVPDAAEAGERRLQDWAGWLDRGLLDVVCPMVYTTDPATFAAQVEAVRGAAGSRPVWAGIGAYRLTPAQIVANVRTARRIGVAGVVLFSYDSPAVGASGPASVAEIGRAAFPQ